MENSKVPYFYTNPEWWYYDGEIYKLTDKATQEAKDSYEQYYKELESCDDEMDFFMV